MAKLNTEILSIIVDKSGLAEQTIRNNVSKIKRKYPRCTANAAAQLLAVELGFSVFRKLTKEDKDTLPNHEIEKVTVRVNKRKKKKLKKILEFINYPTTDHFQKGHIEEINRAYSMGCYTSAYILSRKVIENLVLDIIRKNFPPTKLENKELYWDISRRRYKDFEIILKNLYKKRNSFHINSIKPIERLYEKAKNFKDRANDTAHSWYYLIEKKKELDDLNIGLIVQLIKAIQKDN